MISQTILPEGDPSCPLGGVEITTQLSDGSNLQTTILCSGMALPSQPVIGPVDGVSLPSETQMPDSNFVAVASGAALGYYSVSVSPDATSISIVFDLPTGISAPPTILFFDAVTQTFVSVQSASTPLFSVADHTLTILINEFSFPLISQLRG